MRLTLWLILILAFSVGMCCAFTVRYLYFDAKPVVAKTSEPTMKILVAKRTIPSGVEITADFVVFQDVAVSEVPLGSLTSFAQVYRRQPAYPIPTGCPICEDLLVSPGEPTVQAAFLPLGSQIVALDVIHVRQGNKVFLPPQNLSTLLATDQRIDVRVVPRNEVQGKLAEKKNEVLRTFATQDFKESGELLLENVPIHRVQEQSNSGQTGSSKVLLVLDKNEETKLMAAAKRGQLRILVHQEPVKTASLPVEIATVSEIAASSVQTLPVSLPFEPLPIEVPLVSAPLPSTSMEPVLVAPTEGIQKTFPAPKTLDIFDSVLPPAPIPVPDFVQSLQKSADEIPQNPDPQSDGHADASMSELVIKEKIRNDASILVFGTPALRIISERSAEQKPVPMNATNEPGQESSTFTDLGTVADCPRVFQSLPFRSPGKVTPTNENSKGATKQAETAVAPLELPLLMSLPIITEKVPGYSPFERRTYTVLLNEDLGESPDGLPTPPRLLRNSDLGTQTQ